MPPFPALAVPPSATSVPLFVSERCAYREMVPPRPPEAPLPPEAFRMAVFETASRVPG